MTDLKGIEPQVSVVVITYNHEKFIEQCVRSVATQHVDFDFEVLLAVDDGGDQTLNIVNDLAKEFKHVRVLLNAPDNVAFVNGHRIGRMNMVQAYKAAKGEYIATCDGDDYWIDEFKLQRQIDFLKKNPEVSLTFTNRRIKLVDSILENDVDLPAGEYSKEDVIRGLVAFSQTMAFRNHSDLANFLEEFKDIQGGDYLITYFFSERGKIIYDKNRITAVYRKQIQSNWASKPLDERLAQTIRQMRVIKERLRIESEDHIHRKIRDHIVQLLPFGIRQVSKYMKLANIPIRFVGQHSLGIIVLLVFNSAKGMYLSIKRNKNAE